MIETAIKIIDLQPDDEASIRETAEILHTCLPQGWPTLESALEEVRASFGPDRISRIAVAHPGYVVGWIGGIRQYDGNVWELHPLVVRPDFQGRRIGTWLVRDLEERVEQRGGLTLWLGSDDENNSTSLGGVDLFPNVLEHLSRIENRNRHPYEFYQKLGFSIVGVMPDANGPGKPDIYLAKSLNPQLSALTQHAS